MARATTSVTPRVMGQNVDGAKPGDIGGGPLHVPVACDDVISFFKPVTADAPGRPVLRDEDRLVLYDGVRARADHVGTIVQHGRWTRYLTAPTFEMLRQLKDPLSVADIVRRFNADRDFLAHLVRLDILRDHAKEPSTSRAIPGQFYVDPEPTVNYHATPVGLMLEITNKCFRTCSYCAYSSGPNPTIPLIDELPTEWWLAKISEAADIGVLVIEFTGGDPLVRPDAFEIMEAADRLGIGLMINSDLSVLQQADVERLAELKNILAIQTSLDGADPATCDQTRGRGSFKSFINQIRQLKAAQLPVTVGTTVTANNFDQITKVAAVVGAEGVDGLYISPMYAAGRGVQLTGMLVDEHQWFTACLQFASAIAAGEVAPTHYRWYEVAETLLSDGVNLVQDQPVMASRADYNLRVDPRGNTYTTAKLREINPRYRSVGDLRTIPLRSIWRASHLLNELRSYPTEPNVFNGIDVRRIPADPGGVVVHDETRKDGS